MDTKGIQRKYIVVFDLDSGSVGGSILEYEFNKKNEIISVRSFASVRKSITDGTHYDFSTFWMKAQKTFDEVAGEIYLHSLVPLSGIFCNVGSPWISSQKRVSQYKKKEPFIIDSMLIQKLENKELKASLKRNLDYHSYDVALVDRQTLDYYVNGYPVKQPEGKEAHDLEIHSLISVMSTETKKRFEEIVQKHFHRDPVFLSNPFVFYYGVKTLLPYSDDVIVLDVGPELTEILVIDNDHFRNFGVFPSGVHSIVRSLSGARSFSYREARDTIELFHAGILSSPYTESLEDDIQSAFFSWLRPFYNVLDELSKRGLLPHVLVIKTHDNLALWFESMILTQDELTEHLKTHGRIELYHLSRYVDQIFHDINDPEMKVLAHYLSHHTGIFSS